MTGWLGPWCATCVSIERIRRDRVLREARTARPVLAAPGPGVRPVPHYRPQVRARCLRPPGRSARRGCRGGALGSRRTRAGSRSYPALKASGQGAAACSREDTEDMNRERAEGYLRQLAEAELRRARTLPAAGIRRPQNSAGFALVAQALVAVGAVNAGTADQIRADLELAVAVRQPGQENPARLMRGFSGRAGTAVALALSTGYDRPAPPRASRRVVPVGKVIHVRDGDARHELLSWRTCGLRAARGSSWPAAQPSARSPRQMTAVPATRSASAAGLRAPSSCWPRTRRARSAGLT